MTSSRTFSTPALQTSTDRLDALARQIFRTVAAAALVVGLTTGTSLAEAEGEAPTSGGSVAELDLLRLQVHQSEAGNTAEPAVALRVAAEAKRQVANEARSRAEALLQAARAKQEAAQQAAQQAAEQGAQRAVESSGQSNPSELLSSTREASIAARTGPLDA